MRILRWRATAIRGEAARGDVKPPEDSRFPEVGKDHPAAAERAQVIRDTFSAWREVCDAAASFGLLEPQALLQGMIYAGRSLARHELAAAALAASKR
jgi:hypothetical protein